MQVERAVILGYSPLGKGQVKLDEILTLLEKKKKKMAGMIMFELDYQAGGKPPYSNFEAAKISRDFLAQLNYKFEEKNSIARIYLSNKLSE